MNRTSGLSYFFVAVSIALPVAPRIASAQAAISFDPRVTFNTADQRALAASGTQILKASASAAPECRDQASCISQAVKEILWANGKMFDADQTMFDSPYYINGRAMQGFLMAVANRLKRSHITLNINAIDFHAYQYSSVAQLEELIGLAIDTDAGYDITYTSLGNGQRIDRADWCRALAASDHDAYWFWNGGQCFSGDVKAR